MRHHILKLLALIFLTTTGQAPVDATQASKKEKPNIVLILVDDSGLMDFSSFGGEANTPNIDRLAANGLMCTNMHASPVCSPSRAMLMTGSDSHLAGVANLPEMLPEEYQGIEGYGGVLNDRVQTIATRLKEADYTNYVTGKWHLGHDNNNLPVNRGFDRSFILGGSGASNYNNSGYLPMKPLAHWYADGQEVELPDNFYSSKTYIDKVISFHEEEKNPDNPFFSYIAFQAIHAPIQAPREFVEPYLETYNNGWNELRTKRFERAKELGIIPENSNFTDPFPEFKKWDELTNNEKKKFATNMAVTAGMLEAMDYHIGRYVQYLTEKGLIENTVFIVTSDNGPDGGDYRPGLPWALTHGYHRNFEKKGGDGYFGYLGPEFGNALSSPFSFYKYYTGEGGLRVPLIFSGMDIPIGARTNEFCFFTDIAPTIYDIVGLSTSANEDFAPITGKSILPHILDPSQSVYAVGEGVGLEAASSSAYFLDGYKIVKNNIPLGDNQWHMYNLMVDPVESEDLVQKEPERFQEMLAAYEAYEQRVGVVAMPEGYSATGEVAKKSFRKIFFNWLPYLSGFIIAIIALVIWRRRRKRNKRKSS